MEAAAHGRAEAVALLLGAAETDPNLALPADGATALHMACQHGNTECVRLLMGASGIAAGCALADDGSTALHLASEFGHTESVCALLAGDGVDADLARTTDGATALILAAQEGHDHVLRTLVTAGGADLNRARTTDGATALVAAFRNGHSECVEGLLAVPGGLPDAQAAAITGAAALVAATCSRQAGPELNDALWLALGPALAQAWVAWQRRGAARVTGGVYAGRSYNNILKHHGTGNAADVSPELARVHDVSVTLDEADTHAGLKSLRAWLHDVPPGTPPNDFPYVFLMPR
jgi:hypothetical protein